MSKPHDNFWNDSLGEKFNKSNREVERRIDSVYKTIHNASYSINSPITTYRYKSHEKDINNFASYNVQ